MGGRRVWSTKVKNVEARESREAAKANRPRQVWVMPDTTTAPPKGAKGAQPFHV